MSGGPPHHPHNRQVPTANTAWNHLQGLQVPNFFPRQPQLAHMSNEHSLIHQPTWHTPTTTEAMKIIPHSHMLSEMLKNDPLFPRDCVDLSLTRNGNQNGELPTSPISLSVRDTNKINSLPPGALEIQPVELTKPASPGLKIASPGLKSASPGLMSTSPGLKSASPGIKPASPSLKSVSPSLKSPSPGLKSVSTALAGANPVLKSASSGLLAVTAGLKSVSPVPNIASPVITAPLLLPTSLEVTKMQKRSNIRVDSILERLNSNSTPDKIVHVQENKPDETPVIEKAVIVEKPVSVIVQPSSSFDENSNSSSILNVPSSTNIRDEDTGSTYSNEDSLDSNKSRRKRKPSKTIRVSKEDEKIDSLIILRENVEPLPKQTTPQNEPEKDPICIVGEILEENKVPERRRSSEDLGDLLPAKTRRKTSSESETIDNIAAMVQEGLKEKQLNSVEKAKEAEKPMTPTKPISVSVIKTKENLTECLSDALSSTSTPIITPTEKKVTNPHFVEVENKLEEMFAGIEDSSDPLKTDTLDLDDTKLEEDSLLKLEDPPVATTSQETATVSSSTEVRKKPSPKKAKRRSQPNSRRNSESLDTTPKKKKANKSGKVDAKIKSKVKSKKPVNLKQTNNKVENVKDVYAYDSGSNASSSRSRGPFIQIRGPRDSPLSVNVVNTPLTDEDGDRKQNKIKKYHDDMEYRHKVRSKGLHCSTLSNKYDAQTKDTSWICAFCKRGPHASELSGPTSNGEVIPPGDLFGPYFITTQCPEFERRLDDPYDKQFKSKKIVRALEEVASLKSMSGKKSKRKHSDFERSSENESDIYLGITETSNRTYEIWAHEDCIVWSPGIYLVGPKIVGLEEAVWTSCNVPCRHCHLKGANICCMKRGCLGTIHLCCARSQGWQFAEDTFKACCPLHAQP